MYEVSIKTHFSAAHRLVGYKGACEHLHGHNWDVEVFIRGSRLNATGLLVDFHDVKDAVRDALEGLDHGDLNAIAGFKGANPSSENIAAYIHGRLKKRFGKKDLRVHSVRVWETPGNAVRYWEGDE